MSWTALVPVKSPPERKMRLAGSLSPDERQDLSAWMLDHVLGVLAASPDVGAIVIVSPERLADWSGPWIGDRGRGLNAELEDAAKAVGDKHILVIHADLPLLCGEDLAALLAAAEDGCAIAPDRHRTGTNALAFAEREDLAFAFGPGSFRRHCEAARGEARIVERPGLALDVDTPDDFSAAVAAGFRLPGME